MTRIFAIFGAITALNTLIGIIAIKSQQNWMPAFLWIHSASHGLLIGMLAAQTIKLIFRKARA